MADQISFIPKLNRIQFDRNFKENFQYINPLIAESKLITRKLGDKLKNFLTLLEELDYRFEIDILDKKQFFKDDYLKEHNLKNEDFPWQGFLPNLLALNPSSKSTPLRIVIVPNRAGFPRYRVGDN